MASGLLLSLPEQESPMSAKSELAIRAAVMNGFARCSESDAPLCSLGEFIERLRDLRWEPHDIRTVEAGVLDLLRQSKEGALKQRQQSDAA
jgi:hypothetical protein